MKVPALVILLFASVAVAQLEKRSKGYVTADAVPSITLQPGQIAQAELHFRVNPGFHVNSHTPGSELLIPTTLDFKSPARVKAGTVVYPKGQQMSLEFSPNEKLSVYSGDIVTQVPIIVAKNAAPGKYSINGEFKYQACNDRSCFPPKSLPVEITVVVKK